ncbi:MAG: thermonuclease family protein [Candidatus Aenigmarchaeota archaeon]|nr:thermonuclease family protein [Candidatus Aenigmarchaeota archaeon]
MKRIAVCLILIILISGCVKESDVYVSKVIDGDTIVLSNGEHVRLLGINAPEKDEYYYNEATERLTELVAYKQVRLESDKTNRDTYGRLLRYVYVNDKMVNSKLLEEGCARLYIFESDKKYEKSFIYAENYAKNQNLGIWNNNH